jgi:hypothetical protein
MRRRLVVQLLSAAIEGYHPTANNLNTPTRTEPPGEHRQQESAADEFKSERE